MDHGLKDGESPRLRKPRKPTDRVRLKPNAVEKLDQWMTQIQENVKGVWLTRADLVNWLVQDRAESLSSSDLKAIGERHFDELKFAHWAIAELKKARERGEERSLADILQGSRSVKSEPSSRNKKRPLTEKQASPGPEKPATDSSEISQKTLENMG